MCAGYSIAARLHVNQARVGEGSNTGLGRGQGAIAPLENFENFDDTLYGTGTLCALITLSWLGKLAPVLFLGRPPPE